ncbi:hypothetical protein F2Q68_00017521 [Brassica cretica]|uniref:Retrotransposon gag domain-containing protein n=1 Tax=Brassica cretica TaxID=69181 RepID=A0A8S9HJQ2_BRACR|nr:hypothetical protein F2Q68_00017521 [Brassica cretica]
MIGEVWTLSEVFLMKIPETLSKNLRNAFSWFSQLQPRSLTCWEEINTAFLNKYLYEATTTREKEKNDKWDRLLALLEEEYMIPIQLLDDIMAKRDEQHVSGELSRVGEAGTKDTTSTLIDITNSTSIDITTSTSIDITTSTSIDITTSTSIDITTSTSIDNMTSMSTDDKTSTSINRSTQKSTNVSSCVLVPDVDREITMEDFLELEEETTPENLDHNLEKKLDDHQHTSKKDMATSLEASIGRRQPDEIDRQPPHIIDLHPPDINLHRQPLIDRHQPPNIDRFPLLDVPPGCIIEMEPIEERMYMSKASHLAVPKHQRSPIWTEEADGFDKRVKRIHDPVKIVVPCAVFEAESPIPPDRSMQFSSYIEGPAESVSINTDRIPSIDTNKPASIDTTTSPSIDTTASPSIDSTTSSSIDTGRVLEHKDFDVCGNLKDGGTTTRSDKSGGKKKRNWKKRKKIKGDSQLSFIPHFSDGVRKSRVRSRCFSQPFAKLRALHIAEMIDKGEDIYRHCSKEIDRHCSRKSGVIVAAIL